MGNTSPKSFAVSVRAVRGRNLMMVTRYPFDGNPNDASGFMLNGTVMGPTLAADRHGSPDSAYHFDGVNDFIVASPASGLPTGERTVALWFRADRLDTRPVLLGYGAGDGTSWLMSLNGGGSRAYVMTTTRGDVSTITYPWASAPIDVWTHFAVTTDATGTRIYVNGTEVAMNDTSVTGTAVSGTSLGIGVASAPDGSVPYTNANFGYFAGDIDDVRIYVRALSAEELRVLAGS